MKLQENVRFNSSRMEYYLYVCIYIKYIDVKINIIDKWRGGNKIN